MMLGMVVERGEVKRAISNISSRSINLLKCEGRDESLRHSNIFIPAMIGSHGNIHDKEMAAMIKLQMMCGG